nr:hypothetical protein [uncultured Holophaga sp.]
MRACTLFVLCATLGAQSVPPLDSSFFEGSPRQVMVRAADKARVRAPGDSRFLARWGGVYLVAGQEARAEDAFRRALAAGADDPATHALICIGWLQAKRPGEARKAYAAMPVQGSDAAAWLARLAPRMMDAGLEKEGTEAMEKAWLQAPDNWQGSLEFGGSALRAKHPELAGTWFYRAARVRPDDEELWTRIAQAYADGLR